VRQLSLLFFTLCPALYATNLLVLIVHCSRYPQISKCMVFSPNSTIILPNQKEHSPNPISFELLLNIASRLYLPYFNFIAIFFFAQTVSFSFIAFVLSGDYLDFLKTHRHQILNINTNNKHQQQQHDRLVQLYEIVGEIFDLMNDITSNVHLVALLFGVVNFSMYFTMLIGNNPQKPSYRDWFDSFLMGLACFEFFTGQILAAEANSKVSLIYEM